MLAWLAKLLESTDTPIGTVLHIGAGVGAELPLYRDLKCEHVLAIEPDSTLFKKLKAKAKRFDNVGVKQAWIADTAAERNAIIFTNPRFNSLLPADNTLLTHFPNVKNTETLTVKTESFDELVTSNIKKTDEKLNLLILDVQGFETVLFKNSPASTLQLFNWIVVRGSDEVLFEGGANTSEIKQCLTKQGFELRFSERNQLPFVEQYYELNKSIIELNTAKSQLEKLNNQSILEKAMVDEVNQLLLQQKALNTQLEEKLTKSDEQFSALQASHKELRSELNQNIETTQQTVQDKEKHIESLKMQLVKLTEGAHKNHAKLDSALAHSDQLSEQIEKLKQLEDEKNRVISSLQIRKDELTKELKAAEKLLDEAQKKLAQEVQFCQESKKAAENLNNQLGELKHQVSTRQKTSDLALKLQTKAQVDLDDLREKYQAKYQNEQQLIHLIKELRQKLQQASQFYFYLQEHYPNLSALEITKHVLMSEDKVKKR
jgi:FkbM family methyltransferase